MQCNVVTGFHPGFDETTQTQRSGCFWFEPVLEAAVCTANITALGMWKLVFLPFLCY